MLLLPVNTTAFQSTGTQFTTWIHRAQRFSHVATDCATPACQASLHLFSTHHIFLILELLPTAPARLAALLVLLAIAAPLARPAQRDKRVLAHIVSAILAITIAISLPILSVQSLKLNNQFSHLISL